MKSIISKLNNGKKRVMMIMTAALVMAYAGAAGAQTPQADTATVTAVTNGMSGLQMTALAVVAGIAGIAILLFAAPFAWQYGKKIFKTVAR